MTENSTKKVQAAAEIDGIPEPEFRNIRGIASFTQTKDGVLTAVEVTGLPVSMDLCRSPVFAFHIHDEKGHYNPGGCMHPYHAGDLPPLFGNQGYALQIVLTDRFTVHEITGLKVVIHQMLDDFTTQPSGNPGKMIASGIIKPVNPHSGERMV